MKTKLLLLATIGTAWVSPASAIILGVDFEGIGNDAIIDEFYNGGVDSQLNSGPNLGLQFAGGSRAIIDSEVGGDMGFVSYFENEPSPNTVMYYEKTSRLSPPGVGVVNLDATFEDGFSFFYSQKVDVSQIEVFTGLNGTGDSLGVFQLVGNHQNGCAGAFPDIFCNWDIGAFEFDGVAKSLILSGAAGKVLFDNLTLGSLEPVPLPAAVFLLGSGLLGFAAVRRRRQVAA